MGGEAEEGFVEGEAWNRGLAIGLGTEGRAGRGRFVHDRRCREERAAMNNDGIHLVGALPACRTGRCDAVDLGWGQEFGCKDASRVKSAKSREPIKHHPGRCRDRMMSVSLSVS